MVIKQTRTLANNTSIELINFNRNLANQYTHLKEIQANETLKKRVFSMKIVRHWVMQLAIFTHLI